MASDGIVLSGESLAAVPTAALEPGASPVANDPGDDPLTIVMYVDYLCPYCAQFEEANSETIGSLVSEGRATLEVHPIAILDGASAGSRYSTRAANAAACVANYDPDDFYTAHMTLFANQPEEGTAGLSDDELIALLAGAGVTDADVAACVTGGEFTDWLTDATSRVTGDGIPASDVTPFSGTPTVVVGGTKYTGAPGDAEAFTALLASKLPAAGNEPSAG